MKYLTNCMISYSQIPFLTNMAEMGEIRTLFSAEVLFPNFPLAYIHIIQGLSHSRSHQPFKRKGLG
jgi:hypothetical protein